MTARKKTDRKAKSSVVHNRRLARKQSHALNFEALESRQLLAAITVSNNTDLLSPTADTSSIAALIANDGGDGISLREAIAAADNTAGEDVVTFAGSVFTGGQNSLIRLTQGELSISDSLTVDGSSVGGVVITGDANGDDITFPGTYVTDVLANPGSSLAATDSFLRDNSRVLNFTAISDDLVLTGLTITGGALTTIMYAGGAGIGFSSDGNLTLNQTAVSGNSTQSNEGGGIFASGDLTLNNSTVSGNDSGRGGGGIYSDQGLVLLTNNSLVDGNISSRVGGGILSRGGGVSVTDSTVSENSTASIAAHGGGIYSRDGGVSLTNSTVVGNSLTDSNVDGGGIYTRNGDVSLTNSMVSGNSAAGFSSNGGGIFTNVGVVSLINSTVSGNVSGGSGGGIYTVTSGVSLTGSTVSGNSGGRNGGGIHFRGSGDLSLDNSTVSDNNSVTGGGGIRISYGDVSLDNSSVSGNSSLGDGGGILSFSGAVSLVDSTVSGNSTTDNEGGGIFTYSGNVSLLRSAVSDNSAIGLNAHGGGIVTSSGAVSLISSTVSDNSSNDDGGGIYVSGDDASVSLTDSTVSGNRSVDHGGGIRITSGVISLTDSTVSGNVSEMAGGGIFTSSGSVVLNNSTVSDNNSLYGFGGGGISAFGASVFLTSSTVSGNSSLNGGGIFAGSVSLTNSTVSGNSSDIDGGGISAFSSVVLVNSTLVDNSAAGVGGGISFVLENAGVLTLHNSIVSDNVDVGTAPNITFIMDSNNLIVEHSLIGDTTGSGIVATTGTGNILNQTAMLGALADNGGPTQTHALLLGSPAIDAGNEALAVNSSVPLQSDQRNGLFSRSFDDPSTPGTGVDIGAFELHALLVDNPIDEDDGIETGGDLSLREAVRLANVNPALNTITFDPAVFTGGDDNLIRLTLGELSISDRLTIDATPVGGVVITGDADDDDVTFGGTNITDVSASFGGTAGASGDLLDDNSRVLNFSGSDNLELLGLTITGGRTTSDFANGGGIYTVDGNVSLTNSTVAGNSTAGYAAAGGGVFSTAGDVSLNNSTVSGNSSGDNGNGGGIFSGVGDVSLSNSTVSTNSTGDNGNGGGIFSTAGDVSLINSTLSGNVSDGDGAGLRSDDSVLLVVNSTVTDNSAAGVGGGVSFSANTPEAEQFTLYNSIVAGNTDNGTAPDFLAPSGLTNELIVEHSLIGDTTGSGITSATGAGNILNQSALLGPLADNGGLTLTHSLLPASPANDAGDNSLALDESGNLLTTDQRGEERIQFVTVDIGAVENLIGIDRGVVVTIAQDIDDSTDGFTSLREAIAFANADVDAGDVGLITFDASVFTGGDNNVIRLTQGELSVGVSLIIDGSSVGGVVITGDADDDDVTLPGTHITDVSASFGGTSGAADDLLDDNSRILNFSAASGDITLTGLTITGGRVTGNVDDGGGIYTASGNVSLISSSVSGNSSGDNGGGIGTASGSVSLTNSTVSGNSSGDNGGGIGAISGSVSLTNSTVSGNSSDDSGGGINTVSGSVSSTNSTVSGNSAGDFGGGIGTISGRVSLINSTVSGNSSGFDGGGIRVDQSTVLIVNSTVTNNSSSRSGGGLSFRPNGAFGGPRLTLQNSILAGNTVNRSAPDFLVVGGVAAGVTVEHSLIGDTSGSGITIETGTGNILNQSPLLGPLSDNGGPTQTHALLSGSLAINTGSNAIASVAGVFTDQRGEGRIEFGATDIGAFESDFNERNLVVTTNQDIEDQTDGVTSLREAIAFSNSNESVTTISFDSSEFSTPTTINILSQLPTITGTLTITGPGANLLTVDALGGGDNVLDGNGFRIFEVNDGDSSNSLDVSISGLTLTGGDNNDFGGAISNTENLTLNGVSIVGNRASFGGGVSNELPGGLTITNSTITNNIAGQDGGGIFVNGGELTAANITISGNSAVGNGSAIATQGDSLGVTLNLTQSTITSNIGSGVHFNNGNGLTIATFNNTIVDNSVVGVGNNSSTLAGGNNLFAGADPGISGTGNLFNQTSLLGPLANNGGPTLTHALLEGSPAFDAGDSALAVDENGDPLTTDQRGEDRIRFGAVDIGAFETPFAEVRSLVVTTAQDVDDPSDGLTSLREAIAFAEDPLAGVNFDGDADGDGLAVDTIAFDPSVFTGGDASVIRLAQGELVISESLTVDGSSVGGVVISGDAAGNDITLPGTAITDVDASSQLLADNHRVLDFISSGRLTLTGLAITGGVSGVSYAYGGGIRSSFGDLFLNNSTVSGNSAAGYLAGGGGIFAFSGVVSLTDSTVSGNRVTVASSPDATGGGGIQTGTGDVLLTNSTISGNIGEFGGGIYTRSGDVSLVNSTLTGNLALAIGGGIRIRINSGGNELRLSNSIVAGNTANQGSPDLSAANVVEVSHSLIGDTTGSGITATTGIGNILNQAVLLGPLADNGGSTLTHALLPGSPAINAGNNALTLDQNGNALTTDQRGAARIESGTVDIGAVEFQEFVLGDVNLDGNVDFLDISPFVSLLSGSTFLDEADINRDGSVNFLDVSPFISLLSSDDAPEPFVLGDANLDGNVDFLDISRFVSLLSGGTFLDEADINRDGSVNFLDVSPFISLLSSDDATEPFVLGDANLDGNVDFLDISPFVSLLSGGAFLDEADIDRNGGVDFLDISPFVSLLSSGGSSTATSQSIVVSPPVSSAVSQVSFAVSEPASIGSVASTVAGPVMTKTLDPKQVDATEPLPQAPLVLVSDSPASPFDLANNLPVVDTSGPVVLAPADFRSSATRSSRFRAFESNGPLVKQRSPTGIAESRDLSQESSDTRITAKVTIEESYSTAAELFDASPESLDHVFDSELEETLAGLIE